MGIEQLQSFGSARLEASKLSMKQSSHYSSKFQQDASDGPKLISWHDTGPAFFGKLLHISSYADHVSDAQHIPLCDKSVLGQTFEGRLSKAQRSIAEISDPRASRDVIVTQLATAFAESAADVHQPESREEFLPVYKDLVESSGVVCEDGSLKDDILDEVFYFALREAAAAREAAQEAARLREAASHEPALHDPTVE